MVAPAVGAIAAKAAPVVLPIAAKAAEEAIKAIGRGISVNSIHANNRRKCGYSVSEYRRKGGYKSRTALCKRRCYKQKGKCEDGDD